jgi:Rrf2 family protein
MKSTKFVTACYILSFVSYHGSEMLTTPTIARWVNTNPSRVRQIVAALVRAGLLSSTRGGEGGVMLGRDAATITLLDVFEAVADQELQLFSIDNPFSDWKDRCHVHSVLKSMRERVQDGLRAELERTPLAALHAAPGKARAARRRVGEALATNAERTALPLRHRASATGGAR